MSLLTLALNTISTNYPEIISVIYGKINFKLLDWWLKVNLNNMPFWKKNSEDDYFNFWKVVELEPLVKFLFNHHSLSSLSRILYLLPLFASLWILVLTTIRGHSTSYGVGFLEAFKKFSFILPPHLSVGSADFFP